MKVHQFASLSLLLRSAYTFRVGNRAQIPFLKPRRSLSIRSVVGDDLVEQIRYHWETKETDGIIDLASGMDLSQCNLEDLLFASLESVQYNKGQAAGIINSWIASCSLQDDEANGAELAWRLLETYQDIADSLQIYPDVVTLCLTYNALSRPMEQNYHMLGQLVLDKAQKLSKKQGGSKRRKSIVKSKRKLQGVRAGSIENQLQKLCGPDFGILHETDHLLVVAKPSGMVCFHRHKTSSGKITASRLKKDLDGVDVSLEDALLSQGIPLSTLNPEGRGLVHRIDRGTSGCIILAKTDDMHARLLTEFFLRRVKKTYHAVVASTLPLDQNGILDLPVGGRPAVSTYSVLEHYSGVATALQLETKTGRKHQVRVHCTKGLDAPILLDPLYTDEEDQSPDFLPHGFAELIAQSKFFLHASSLSIPTYGVDVKAPPPEWWKNAVMQIRQG